MSEQKKVITFVFLIALLGVLLSASPAQGKTAPSPDATYQISAYTLVNGGGTVTGGSYTMNSSIGQFCAGSSAGLNNGITFTLACGIQRGPSWHWHYLYFPFAIR